VNNPSKGQSVRVRSFSFLHQVVSLFLISYSFLSGASLVGLSGVPVRSSAQAALAASSVAVNVKDFGARGDGVADDTLAFKRAFRQLESAGQNIIDIPAGRYRLDSRASAPDPNDPGANLGVRVTRDVTVRGAGVGQTVLKAIPGVVTEALDMFIVASGVKATFQDMTLEGPNDENGGIWFPETGQAPLGSRTTVAIRHRGGNGELHLLRTSTSLLPLRTGGK